MLEAQVNNEEVYQGIFVMKPWKVPGRLFAGFYEKTWGIVGNKVCDFVCGVWEKQVRLLWLIKMIYV